MLILTDDKRPLYIQVYEGIRQAILAGELNAGQKLVSSRKLATEVDVSRNIILLAYDQLIAEGYAETRQGAGTFVSSDLPALPALPKPVKTSSASGEPRLSGYAKRTLKLQPGSPHATSQLPRYPFRYGLVRPDAQLQTIWKKCLNQASQRMPLNYDVSEGSLELRETLVQYLKSYRGVTTKKENIVITSGSQQALYLVSQALLEPGQQVLIEEPHYQGARQIFLAHGATLVPSLVDQDGMQIPEQGASLAYVTPSHQFPLGSIMSFARRLELLAWTKHHDAYILEDDYDSEFRYEGRPVAAIQGLDTDGRVIYIGTFSKTLFPSLRLGFLVLPDSLLTVVKGLKWLVDRHSSSLDQISLNLFIQEGRFEQHLRRSRIQHALRRKVLLEALEQAFGKTILVTGSNAGVHLVVWFPNLSADLGDELGRAAFTEDVGIYPIAPYYLTAPKMLGLVFGYAYLNEAEIREGIRRFAKVIKSFSQDNSEGTKTK